MEVKRKRGRPKGSKNKPKKLVEEPKRKRGRPKGSKNKPKVIEEPKRKRGRPRKESKPPKSWPEYEGVSWVKRRKGPQSESHRWVAVFDHNVVGYYKTPEEASKAYNEINKGNKS